MFAKTSNPYRFKYLITGITGPGIKEVYLPPTPPDEDILFHREQKFTRPVIPDNLQQWMDELVYERSKKDRQGNLTNLDYAHEHQAEINEWEDCEWNRCTNGIWFWNGGVKTYITGNNYKYLTAWDPGFIPDFREPLMEIFYWIAFWEEDPNSFGGCLNTLRRGGKSSIMGLWIVDRSTTNFKHLAGMQGEANDKIQDFYNQFVMAPFYKMPYYFQPTYDTTTLQKKGIIFNEPPRRNVRRVSSKRPVLESQIDYRTSEENKYDRAKLHSYVGEEWGKNLNANVSKTWGFIKPCHTVGIHIIGKSFIGTTVEYMNVANKGGKAYQKLCFSSDYDVRTANGETVSGLFAALMPADCLLEGYFDVYGRPDRKKAMQWILNGRAAVKNNPGDYADLVRKYPTSWREVFYISAENCEFNIVILEERKGELVVNPPPIRRFDLRWENNVRFSKIIPIDNPQNGWLKMAWFPQTEQELKWLNNVNKDGIFKPLNDNIFAIGIDPIDHGVVVENTMGTDGFVSSRRSRPVLLIKRKYDIFIDGQYTQELLEQRAQEKYHYKTGRYIGMMDIRPNDPNVFFERALMICWLLGTTAQIESQKPGIINWYNDAGCQEFTWMKYVPQAKELKLSDQVQGTPATPKLTQEYTSLIATDIEYFGHTYPFIEMVEDDRVFNPNDTKSTDYSVAQGNTEIACKMRPKVAPLPTVMITDYFRRFRRDGSIIK